MVQRGDELVAFVWETVGLVALRDSLHLRLLPALALVGVKDLMAEGRRRPTSKQSQSKGEKKEEKKEAFLWLSSES